MILRVSSFHVWEYDMLPKEIQQIPSPLSEPPHPPRPTLGVSKYTFIQKITRSLQWRHRSQTAHNPAVEFHRLTTTVTWHICKSRPHRPFLPHPPPHTPTPTCWRFDPDEGYTILFSSFFIVKSFTSHEWPVAIILNSQAFAALLRCWLINSS